MESEERIRQNSGLLHLRLNAGIRLPNKPKSDNCTELYLVFMEWYKRERACEYPERSRGRVTPLFDAYSVTDKNGKTHRFWYRCVFET